MSDNRIQSSKLDRRIELSRPTTSVDAYNEAQTVFEVLYTNFPAHRKDSTSNEDETQENKVVRGESRVEWEIRFLPGLNIKTTWKIKDLHDGNNYEIIAPPTEIGRRQGIRITTKLIQ